jgi:two-component system NarL family response regulator
MIPIRIVVAEDHPEFRALLCERLGSAPGLEIVGEAGDGRQAIAAVGRLDPDILTLDIDLPGMNGLEVLRVVRWYSPETKVIILSGQDEEATILEALKHGARGYVLKGGGTDLVKVIRAVHRGEVWARRRVVAQVIEELTQVVAGTLPGNPGRLARDVAQGPPA